MKIITTTLFLISLSSATHASTFDAFQEVLTKHLIEKNLNGGGFESSFDYNKAIQDEQTQKLMLKQKQVLSKFDTQTLSEKKQANAFWINAYNFYMINIVLEKGFEGKKLKISGVKDFGTFFSPYKIFTQKINSIGNKKYSLDQIEKKTLLGENYKKKGWKDARIHFAVNCASVGCPPLIKQIYTASNLNNLLDENIKKALKTSRHFEVRGKDVRLTHLFKWYKKDFTENAGSVKKFLLPYLEDNTEKFAVKKETSFDYIEYDWKLNKPENF